MKDRTSRIEELRKNSLGLSKAELSLAMDNLPPSASDSEIFSTALAIRNNSPKNRASKPLPKPASQRNSPAGSSSVGTEPPNITKALENSTEVITKTTEVEEKLAEVIGELIGVVSKLTDNMKGAIDDIGKGFGKEISKAVSISPGFLSIKERIEGKISDMSEGMSLRGLLDSSGIAKKGGGGMIDTFLAKKEAKADFVKTQMEMGIGEKDPVLKDLSEKEQKKVLRERFEELNVEGKKLEKALSRKRELVKAGYSEEDIAKFRGGELNQTIESSTARIKELDPLRMGEDGGLNRPESDKIDEIEEQLELLKEIAKNTGSLAETKETQPQPSTIIGEPSVIEGQSPLTSMVEGGESTPGSNDASAAQIEIIRDQNAMIEEQTDLLKTIAENTAKDESDNVEPETDRKEGEIDLGFLAPLLAGLKSLKDIVTGLITSFGKFVLSLTLASAPLLAIAAIGAAIGGVISLMSKINADYSKRMDSQSPEWKTDKELPGVAGGAKVSQKSLESIEEQKRRNAEWQSLSQEERDRRIAEGNKEIAARRAEPEAITPKTADAEEAKRTELADQLAKKKESQIIDASTQYSSSSNIVNNFPQMKRVPQNEEPSLASLRKYALG